MKLNIQGSLHCGFNGTVELPEGLKWEDITSWYVKWDNFHYSTKEGDGEIPLNSDTVDTIDWKRPIEGSVSIYEEYEDGDVNYEKDLSE